MVGGQLGTSSSSMMRISTRRQEDGRREESERPQLHMVPVHVRRWPWVTHSPVCFAGSPDTRRRCARSVCNFAQTWPLEVSHRSPPLTLPIFLSTPISPWHFRKHSSVHYLALRISPSQQFSPHLGQCLGLSRDTKLGAGGFQGELTGRGRGRQSQP